MAVHTYVWNLVVCTLHHDRAQAGFTALMMAAARAHRNCVDYLLAVGADVNAQTKVSK